MIASLIRIENPVAYNIWKQVDHVFRNQILRYLKLEYLVVNPAEVLTEVALAMAYIYRITKTFNINL